MSAPKCRECRKRPGRGKRYLSACAVCCAERLRLFKVHHQGKSCARDRRHCRSRVEELRERAERGLPLFD